MPDRTEYRGPGSGGRGSPRTRILSSRDTANWSRSSRQPGAVKDHARNASFDGRRIVASAPDGVLVQDLSSSRSNSMALETIRAGSSGKSSRSGRHPSRGNASILEVHRSTGPTGERVTRRRPRPDPVKMSDHGCASKMSSKSASRLEPRSQSVHCSEEDSSEADLKEAESAAGSISASEIPVGEGPMGESTPSAERSRSFSSALEAPWIRAVHGAPHVTRVGDDALFTVPRMDQAIPDVSDALP